MVQPWGDLQMPSHFMLPGNYRQLVAHSGLVVSLVVVPVSVCLAVGHLGPFPTPRRNRETGKGEKKRLCERERERDSHIRITKKRLPVRRKRRGIVDQRRRQVVARVEPVDGVLAVALRVGVGADEDLFIRQLTS
jgi:hypothetical protein